MKPTFKKTFPLIAGLLALPTLSHANSCNNEFQQQNGSIRQAPDLSLGQKREQLKVQTDMLISEIIRINGSDLSPTELEGLVKASTKEMFDKGHVSWRTGYQNGLIAKLGPNATEEAKAAAITTPRPKPVPKGTYRDAVEEKINSLSGSEREKYLADNGFSYDAKGALQQDINRGPGELVPSLHTKLNGIHEKYSQVAGEFILELVQSGGSLSRGDITNLQSRIHQLWMPENTWKVQGALAKFGVSESEFYSLKTEQVIQRCEQIVRNGAPGLNAEEVAAVRQFTDYRNLSSADKMLDDQILFDHLQNLYTTIRNVVDHRVSNRNLQYRVQKMASRLTAENWIKDAPVLGYRITSKRFEDIPAAIRKHIGAVDATKYTESYLEQNIGSMFALQVKDNGSADFYVIDKAFFEIKYVPTALSEVQKKNTKVFNKVMALMPDMNVNDPNLVGGLKKAPVKMYSLAQLGFPVGTPLAIQSPWGTQVRTPGQDAKITWDAANNMYYMINLEPTTQYPISYVPSAQ